MVWVPEKEMVGVDIFCIREGHPCGGEQLNDTGFDHPAVVLGVYKEIGVDGEELLYCTVAQVSFCFYLFYSFRTGADYYIYR